MGDSGEQKQFIESQRFRHDLVTEQQLFLKYYSLSSKIFFPDLAKTSLSLLIPF